MWEWVALSWGVLAAGVTTWGLWLRSRGVEQKATVVSLERRLDRLEAEVRNVAVAKTASQTPMPRMGVYSGGVR